MKGHGGNRAMTLSTVKSLWVEVGDQVRASGCDLGIWADVPNRRG